MTRIVIVISLVGALFVSGCGLFGGPEVSCGAAPYCRGGEQRVDECPPDGECVERTQCSSTIVCLKSGGDAGSDTG
ncbi:MAG: hypothetical protein ABEN55_08295, partial [Bradymonadaceae bacterium]